MHTLTKLASYMRCELDTYQPGWLEFLVFVCHLFWILFTHAFWRVYTFVSTKATQGYRYVKKASLSFGCRRDGDEELSVRTMQFIKKFVVPVFVAVVFLFTCWYVYHALTHFYVELYEECGRDTKYIREGEFFCANVNHTEFVLRAPVQYMARSRVKQRITMDEGDSLFFDTTKEHYLHIMLIGFDPRTLEKTFLWADGRDAMAIQESI